MEVRTFHEDLQARNICSHDGKMHTDLRPYVEIHGVPGIIICVEGFVKVYEAHHREPTERKFQGEGKNDVCFEALVHVKRDHDHRG